MSVFDELKLFGLKHDDVPDPKDARKAHMPKPSGLKKWIDVYDLNDALSFVMAGVFDGVTDYPYETVADCCWRIPVTSAGPVFKTIWGPESRRH